MVDLDFFGPSSSSLFGIISETPIANLNVKDSQSLAQSHNSVENDVFALSFFARGVLFESITTLRHRERLQSIFLGIFLKFKESSLAPDHNGATLRSGANVAYHCIFKIQRISFGIRVQRCNVAVGCDLIVHCITNHWYFKIQRI
jgi:hypothetical protein